MALHNLDMIRSCALRTKHLQWIYMSKSSSPEHVDPPSNTDPATRLGVDALLTIFMTGKFPPSISDESAHPESAPAADEDLPNPSE